MLCEAARTELLVAVGTVGVGVQLGCRGCTGKSKGLDGVERMCAGWVQQSNSTLKVPLKQDSASLPRLDYGTFN